MKILLDENLDWRLQKELPNHEVKSVPLIGWAGLKNGDLLSKAEMEFEVLITMDGNMASQQNLRKYRIAVMALRAKSDRLADTRPLMAKVLTTLPQAKPGERTVIQ